MDILREKLLTVDPVWDPVRSYLSPEADINSEAAEHRLFQLSGRLSYLFKEYEYSRNEELIAAWNEGRNAVDQQPIGTESWQRKLWNDLFAAEGKLTFFNRNLNDLNKAELHTELFTLPQLYGICRDSQKIMFRIKLIRFQDLKQAPPFIYLVFHIFHVFTRMH